MIFYYLFVVLGTLAVALSFAGFGLIVWTIIEQIIRIDE